MTSSLYRNIDSKNDVIKSKIQKDERATVGIGSRPMDVAREKAAKKKAAADELQQKKAAKEAKKQEELKAALQKLNSNKRLTIPDLTALLCYVRRDDDERLKHSRPYGNNAKTGYHSCFQYDY